MQISIAHNALTLKEVGPFTAYCLSIARIFHAKVQVTKLLSTRLPPTERSTARVFRAKTNGKDYTETMRLSNLPPTKQAGEY